jgi:uncharacterized protein (TIGR02145 family)
MKSILPILAAVLLLTAFTSCKKKGCTDPTATNYDASAEVDDGSCTYPVLPDSGTVTDARDSQSYNWKKIGNQRWMTRNMNYETTDSSWCYGDNPANCDLYGRLYSQPLAIEACPDGWHLATDAEWDELVDFLGGYSASGGAGAALKEGGSAGFNAKYGGVRHPSLGYSTAGSVAKFWTSTPSGTKSWSYGVVSSSDTIHHHSIDRMFGYSCRCVKD